MKRRINSVPDTRKISIFSSILFYFVCGLFFLRHLSLSISLCIILFFCCCSSYMATNSRHEWHEYSVVDMKSDLEGVSINFVTFFQCWRSIFLLTLPRSPSLSLHFQEHTSQIYINTYSVISLEFALRVITERENE